MKKFTTFLLIIFSLSICQTFTDISTGIPGVWNGTVNWGDYDNDGDLDILITGDGYAAGKISEIYRNDSGVFTNINAGLIGIKEGSGEWGDYDNDGDLDLLINGTHLADGSWIKSTKIYQNNNDTFTDINAELTGVTGSCSWGDYDNDGDLDVLVSGYAESYIMTSKIYNNANGNFTDINAGLTEVVYSSADWGDYDNDGDLDILLAGKDQAYNDISKIYRNDSGIFTDINAGLTGVEDGSVSWGDYDNDGYLDILLTGTGDYRIANIYRNDSGVFTDINATIIPVTQSVADWADYDNDGDLDILIAGINDEGDRITKIYRNDSGVFTDINANLVGVNGNSCAWGDYDNDGDLDFLLTGATTGLGYVTKLYRNNLNVGNTSPVSPFNLSYTINENEVEFNWDLATDNETPQNGLSYNIYLGTESQVQDIMSPMSNIIDGRRLIAKFGNAHNNTWILRNLASGTYYWSIQSIDNIYSGSSFSSEQTFTYSAPLSSVPVANTATDIGFYNFTANWNNADLVYGYYLDVATDSLFINYVPGYQNLDVHDVLYCDISDLMHDTEYYYRIRSYNGDHISSNNSNIVSLKTRYKQFSEITTNMTGVTDGNVSWGDYDNDGDLDVLLTGRDQSYDVVSKIYRNDSGEFTDINANLYTLTSLGPEVYGHTSWGDFDNDGDLDVLLTGFYHRGEFPDHYNVYVAYIYQNNSGHFSRIDTGIHGVNGHTYWGDYDNDGDLDILLVGFCWDGSTNSNRISEIFRNDSGIFTDINAGLDVVNGGSADWGDYDNDGDLDIVLTGSDPSYNSISKIYRNDSGVFTDINAGITGMSYGSVVWGDYDNDGDLDILITGAGISKIYRNDSGIFTDINAALQGVVHSSASWGDYDNDGDLDILLTGKYQDGHYVYVTTIYQNNSGVFTDINAGLTGLIGSSADWGDYDNDGDLDIVITGYDSELNYISIIYLNDSGVFNSKPISPGNLATSINGSEINASDVTLSWDKAIDNETPQDGLSYNIYIGTSSMNDEVNPSMSDLSNGYRKVVQIGNVNQNTSWTINNLPDGTYYWSVQAIDHTFTGSDFANEQIITVTGLPMFENISCNLLPLAYGSVEWGDYDNDDDLDLLLTGYSAPDKIAKIYRNDSGVFTDINANLQGVIYSSASWGDYDSDGDLDIIISGEDNNNECTSVIYRNDSGIFTDINASLVGIKLGDTEWFDKDNDGDLDIVLNGVNNSSELVTVIYENDNGIFTDIITGLNGVGYSTVSCSDYDNDGDNDILITGATDSTRISKIYQNNLGIFTDSGIDLPGVRFGSTDWGDYDNDGDLDLLLCGSTESSGKISKIYNNDSGIFTDINAGLEEVWYCSVQWGDSDNDGDLDVLLTGETEIGEQLSKVYTNDNGMFNENEVANLEGVCYSSVSWGDYDNDSDLDIILTGYFNDGSSNYISKIYRNNISEINNKPSSPDNLSSTITGVGKVSLFWDKATDNETPDDGLAYNLCIGTLTGSGNVIEPMANVENGYRKIINIGNVGQNSSWSINNLPEGTYFWSVQAIDHSFAGSFFSSENTFLINYSIPVNIHIVHLGEQTTITWDEVPGATSYKIYASEFAYSGFIDVSNDGNFNGTSWSQNTALSKRFYYVVAVTD